MKCKRIVCFSTKASSFNPAFTKHRINYAADFGFLLLC